MFGEAGHNVHNAVWEFCSRISLCLQVHVIMSWKGLYSGTSDTPPLKINDTFPGSQSKTLIVPIPPIKDTPKEANKGQCEPKVYTLYRKSPLKEDNLFTKDETAGPNKGDVLINCIITSKEGRPLRYK